MRVKYADLQWAVIHGDVPLTFDGLVRRNGLLGPLFARVTNVGWLVWMCSEVRAFYCASTAQVLSETMGLALTILCDSLLELLMHGHVLIHECMLISYARMLVSRIDSNLPPSPP